LTALGREQSKALNEATKHGLQKTVELLVTSGMRRPMSTMVLGYPELRKRLEAEGKPVIVLASLQEVRHPYASERWT
jgi:broad specificity phosphatase PhoE